jgi:hypothetical protein
MSIQNANEQLEMSGTGMAFRKVSQIVKYGDLVDGGGAAGTLVLTKKIPAGSLVIGSKVIVTEGFTGDTTAVMDIGDGSDADLFSYTTHNVLAAARNLMEGCDSAAAGNTGTGIVPISSEASVTITITGGADFGAISAGKLLVEIYYLSTNLELSDGPKSEIDLNNE